MKQAKAPIGIRSKPKLVLVSSALPLSAELEEIIHRAKATQTDRIMRMRELPSKVGRAVCTIYSDINKGIFPPPFAIGERSMGFRESEIDAWIAARALSSCSQEPVDMIAFVGRLVNKRKAA